jgi:hypothetical protein
LLTLKIKCVNKIAQEKKKKKYNNKHTAMPNKNNKKLLSGNS